MDLTAILFPVDFSKASAATAPHVRSFASETGATVTLLHVVPWFAAWYGMSELRPAVAGNQFLHELEKQQEKTLAEFRQTWFGDIACDCLIKSGAVAETIVETAKELNASLIMMPTRGFGLHRPFLIGSTTAKVLHDAACPVWTSSNPAALRWNSEMRNILVPVDVNLISDEYLEKVVVLSSAFNATLHVLSVQYPFALDTEPRLDHAKAEAMRRAIRARFQEISSTHIPRIHIEIGPVGEAVKRVAEREQCDLVIASRGHLQQGGRAQTHIYEIVLRAPCPVLSFHTPLVRDVPEGDRLTVRRPTELKIE